MARKKTWIKSNDGARVFAQRELIHDDGDNCYAWYDEATGNTHVAYDLQEIMERKVIHEQVHKSFHGMSLKDAEAIFGTGFTGKEREDREEAICCHMEARFFDILKALRVLKFPKAPSQ